MQVKAPKDAGKVKMQSCGPIAAPCLDAKLSDPTDLRQRLRGAGHMRDVELHGRYTGKMPFSPNA